ncbi:hypothetical protein AVEN_122415-1 [Araneus ventricosus]|uniref:Uncharacterized protein n=1 Tax=Araneus ventricosus TaxID=182803 RepID=A0A4Y2K1C7_ARAVE|nr:hypothetical protein AVEN_122415-1 [Araneus ventricosus]
MVPKTGVTRECEGKKLREKNKAFDEEKACYKTAVNGRMCVGPIDETSMSGFELMEDFFRANNEGLFNEDSGKSAPLLCSIFFLLYVRNPIPLKIAMYVLTSSRWCGAEVRRGGASSVVVLVI